MKLHSVWHSINKNEVNISQNVLFRRNNNLVCNFLENIMQGQVFSVEQTPSVTNTTCCLIINSGMSEPLLSVIRWNLLEHDKVCPDHSKNMRGVAMVSQWKFCLFERVCMSVCARGEEFDACICGCWGRSYRELAPNVSVKLIRGKWGKKDSILIANYYQSLFWKNNESGLPNKGSKKRCKWQ